MTVSPISAWSPTSAQFLDGWAITFRLTASSSSVSNCPNVACWWKWTLCLIYIEPTHCLASQSWMGHLWPNSYPDYVSPLIRLYVNYSPIVQSRRMEPSCPGRKLKNCWAPWLFADIFVIWHKENMKFRGRGGPLFRCPMFVTKP